MSATDSVVQVFAPLGQDGRGRKGTGYLLGDGLVLTARHVIEGACGPCEVRALGGDGWVAATVLWPGDEHGDGALLRVDAPVGDAVRVRLGRLAGDTRVACEATGFPWSQLQQRDQGAARRTEHLVGKIDRSSGQEPCVPEWLLTIHVEGSVPKARDQGSPWAGMSGAGLVCGELLVGVVIVDAARFGPDRLLAVPLTRLVTAAPFADALSEARDEHLVLEAVEAQGVLERPYEPPPPQRARQSSSFLLGARYGVVAFRPRPELDELRTWAYASEDVDVAMLTGQGGVGKTRLARQLAADLADEDWITGVLAHDFDRDAAASLTRVDAALLVVIDYAETRAEEVVALLGLLARSRRPRRLVLIARQLGDWWTQLLGRSGGSAVRELFECALPIELGIAEKTAQARAGAYAQALAAFVRHTGPPAAHAPEPDLSDRLFETLLFVHMAALGALSGGGAGAPGMSGALRGDLLQRTLKREERYWHDSAHALDPPLDIDAHVRRRAVAVATLTTPTTTATPADEAQAAALLEVVPDLDNVAARRRVARWLHGLYRTSSGWIAPLEPDLLGEALVAQIAASAPELVRDLLGRADVATATRVLIVLTRGSRHHDACRIALADGLEQHLHRLANIAVEIAQQLGDPIGMLLAAALERHPDPALARALLDHVPQDTVSLREAAAVATTQALEGATDNQAQRAGLLVSHSNRLRQLGRREDALTAIDEAVGAYRELAAARPDVFLADLAMALNNQS
ncbi:MAG: serine protease, partial [Actinobacteria bacterium]|nr:serine protease [Actinomycetota bacterium]